MSQSNSKLVFPNASIFAWAPFMQEVRLRCYEWANWVDKPLAVAGVTTARKAALAAQLGALMTYLGVSTLIQGALVTVRNSTGAKSVPSAVAQVNASGVLTSVDLPATAAPITSGQALTGVTPTGTFTTTVTFTVAGGVITAIVLS